MKRRIYTKEERKEHKRNEDKRWIENNKERYKEYHKEYNREYRKREKFKEYIKDNIDKIREEKKIAAKNYRETNPNYIKEWINKNKEYLIAYRKTPNHRATRLASNYKILDKKANRGESTITQKWILDNIFTSKCVYCGEDDWTKLGCDRKDNSLPHTPDNVVCCCNRCNVKKKCMSYDEYMKYINKI